MATFGEPYSGENAFKIWVAKHSDVGRHLGFRGAVIKQGRDVMKIVTLANFGDNETGEVRKRVLRFRTHERSKGETSGWNFDEPDPKTTWWCENDEIQRLLAFLHSDVARTGRYRVVDVESPQPQCLICCATVMWTLAHLLTPWLGKGMSENSSVCSQRVR